MKPRGLQLCVLLAAVAWSSSAHAHSEAIFLAVLLQFGLGGGLVAGIAVVALRRESLSFAWPFGVFLGVVSVVAAIWAQSLAAIPYAIGYGAFAGVLPFVLAYYAARYIAVRVRSHWQARKQPAESQ